MHKWVPLRDMNHSLHPKNLHLAYRKRLISTRKERFCRTTSLTCSRCTVTFCVRPIITLSVQKITTTVSTNHFRVVTAQTAVIHEIICLSLSMLRIRNFLRARPKCLIYIIIVTQSYLYLHTNINCSIVIIFTCSGAFRASKCMQSY